MAEGALPDCCWKKSPPQAARGQAVELPASPTSPAYRRFLPRVGSTPGAPQEPSRDDFEVYYEEEDWIPYSESAFGSFAGAQDISKIPGAPGSNYIIIEEEVVEEIPPPLPGTPTHGSPTIVKRTRRKITRRPQQGPSVAQRLAALSENQQP